MQLCAPRAGRIECAAHNQPLDGSFINLLIRHTLGEIEEILKLPAAVSLLDHRADKALADILHRAEPESYRAVLDRKAVPAPVYVGRQLFNPEPLAIDQVSVDFVGVVRRGYE